MCHSSRTLRRHNPESRESLSLVFTVALTLRDVLHSGEVMMMRDKRSEDGQGGIDSLIGRGCRIEGNVVFQGGLRVDGHIVGDVRAEPQGAGYVIVPPQGRIKGEIQAAHIIVSGEVIGNLHASDRVELLARARIIGNISYAAMTMQAGCSVAGKLWQVDQSNSPAEHAPLAAASGARGYNPKLLIHKAGAFT